jgi:hypothetical protein
VAVAVNLLSCAPAPLLLFGTVRRGPTNLVGLNAPDQGVDQGSDLAVGPNLVEIILTPHRGAPEGRNQEKARSRRGRTDRAIETLTHQLLDLQAWTKVQIREPRHGGEEMQRD